MQHGVLVVVGKMLVLDDLVDFVFAVVVIDLMGKIAREHEGLVTDGFDQMVQRFFSPFATDEYPSRLDVPPDVRAYLFPWSELNILIVRIVLYMGFPSAIKSFETRLQP